MLLKGGKIIPKLVYERIFTLEKKGKEEVEKKNEKKTEYRGVACEFKWSWKKKKTRKEYRKFIL